jgi:hypothetical protein
VKPLQKFIKRSIQEQHLFAWVLGQQSAFEFFTTERAVKSFRKFFNITEEEWPIETMKTTLQRMRNEFLEMEKSPAQSTSS